MSGHPHDEARERAMDILANRRAGDVCNQGECFYPTLPEIAEDLLASLAREEAERERAERAEAALDAICTRARTTVQAREIARAVLGGSA